MIKALFLDRDGVINGVVKKYSKSHGKVIDGSPFNVDELNFKEGVNGLVELGRELNYKPVIITNQPSVLKGEFSLKDYEDITAEICKHLNLERKDVFECLHKEGLCLECYCRKPKPGLFYMAKGVHNIDLSESVMIGDSWKDIKAAQDAGINKTIYLRRMESEKEFGNLKNETEMKNKGIFPDYTCNDLFEVAEKIKELEQSF